MASTLSVSGAASFASTLSVTGATTLNDTLHILYDYISLIHATLLSGNDVRFVFGKDTNIYG